MFSQTEWSIFAATFAGAFVIATCARRLTLSAENSNQQQDLSWLPELEIGALASPSNRASQQHDKMDLWLHRVVSQSGTGLSLENFLLVNFVVATIAGWLTLELTSDILLAVLFGCGMFGLGIAIVLVAFISRRKKFAEQFPVAVDLIACSVAAGQSFRDALETTIDSVEEPTASEFVRCSKQMKMGMSASNCIGRLARRIPTIDVKIFAHTIAVHEEMGGQLGNTLRRMANVIRQRSDDLQKAKSATSLGKFAAVMICSIGVLALLYLLVFQPEYIGKLTSSTLGRQMAIYAIISEIIGIASIFLVLQSEG